MIFKVLIKLIKHRTITLPSWARLSAHTMRSLVLLLMVLFLGTVIPHNVSATANQPQSKQANPTASVANYQFKWKAQEHPASVPLPINGTENVWVEFQSLGSQHPSVYDLAICIKHKQSWPYHPKPDNNWRSTIFRHTSSWTWRGNYYCSTSTPTTIQVGWGRDYKFEFTLAGNNCSISFDGGQFCQSNERLTENFVILYLPTQEEMPSHPDTADPDGKAAPFWHVTPQGTPTHSYEAKWEDQEARGEILHIPAGGEKNVYVEFRNTGSKTWYRTGSRAVYLKIKDAPDDFACSNNTSQVQMEEYSVAPDRVATFRFNLCANNHSPGTYFKPEDYGLWSVEEDNWIADPVYGENGLANAWWKIQIDGIGYEAKWEDQEEAGEILHIPAGGEKNVYVKFRNTGSKRWYRTGSRAVYLKIKDAPDDFACSDNTNQVQMEEYSVGPDSVATFRFNLCANDNAVGRYTQKEKYGLWSVEENNWIADPVHGEDGNGQANVWWDIQINAPDYKLNWVAQSPIGDSNPIKVPINGTESGWVEFVSVGADHPDTDELVLAVYKIKGASTLGPAGDSGSSIFRPANSWLSEHWVSEPTIVRHDGNGNPVYQFQVPLAGNGCSITMVGGGTCEGERSYREDFGVALQSTKKWVLTSSGEEALAWFPIYVQSDQSPEADVLILAPHPDDEILCCAGVIAQAIAEGKTPLVVVATNGDAGTPIDHQRNRDYGRTRQGETLAALAQLGVPARQVLFLGYPDGAEDGIGGLSENGSYSSPFTGKNATYGDYDGSHGGKLDYHTVRFEESAPYNQASVVNDLTQILQDYAPTNVYLPTNSYSDLTPDTAPDHHLAAEFLEEAIVASNLTVSKHYYIVHAPEGEGSWPLPGCPTISSYCNNNPDDDDANARYKPQQSMTPPNGYRPFNEVVPSPANKRTLIETYESQINTNNHNHGYLLAFAKQTEGFWSTLDYTARHAAQSHTDIPHKPAPVPQTGSFVVTATFTNTGLVTWQQGDIWLEVESGTASDFACSSWVSTTKVTSFQENSIAPDETATFEVELCGNDKDVAEYVGTGPNPTSGYSEHFGLRRSNGEWVPALSEGGVHGEAAAWFPISIKGDYMGEFAYQQHTDQPANPALLTPSGHTTSTVVIENTGLKPWRRGEVMLGLKEFAQGSEFHCDEWFDNEKNVAYFEGPGPVEPGEKAVFHVRLCGNGQELREWNGNDEDYKEHFLLYHNGEPVVASDNGNSEGQVEFWVPISVVGHEQIRSTMISPEFGQVFEDTVPFDIRVSKTGGVEIDRVVISYLGRAPQDDDREWREIVSLSAADAEVLATEFKFLYDWDEFSNLPDQPDIRLGVEVIDTEEKAHQGDWCSRVVIAKDPSGFKAKVLETTIGNSIGNAYETIDVDGDDSSPVVVTAAWINTTIDVSTKIENRGTVAWPNNLNDSNHVALYEDDEPMGLCPHSYGERKKGNAFESFDFPEGTFASTAGYPETGVAHATEDDINPGQTGTFNFQLKAPSQAGIYWLDLGLAHGPNWIFDDDVNNGIDSHARLTLQVIVIEPAPPPRSRQGSYRNSKQVGDPVDSYSGNYYNTTTWLEVPTRGAPFTWASTYNALDPQESLLGWGWSFDYDWQLHFDREQIVTVQNGDGRMDEFTNPDANGLYESPPSVNRTLVRNPDRTYSLRFLNQTTYHFDIEGQLASISDRHGNATQLIYNDAGLLSELIDSSGRRYTLRYDLLENRITAFEPPFGEPFQYEYDANGNLQTVIDPTGEKVRYTYDENHRLRTVTDQNNVLYLENEYDAQGRVRWQRSIDNETTFSYDYLANGSGQTIMTDGRGYDWTYVYNNKAWLIEERDPENNAIFYGYDEQGNRNQVTDRRNHTTQYVYDDAGNLTSVTDALNGTTTFQYHDTFNTLTRVEDPLGRVTTHEYDAQGKRTQTTDAGDNITRFEYNQYSQVTKVTNAEGHITEYDYDGRGNRDVITAPGNRVTHLTHNPDGQVDEHQAPDGNVTSFEYDALGRLKSETNALNETTSYEYDKVGNRIQITEPPSFETRYEYDGKDRLVRTIDPMAEETKSGYDPNDNLIAVTDTLDHPYIYSYDSRNWLAWEDDPDGNRTQYEYDQNGNRTAVISADGRRTEFVYDELNRLTQTKAPNGEITVIVYDKVGNEIERIEPDERVTKFRYDELNRLSVVTDTLEGVVQYEYDGIGNRIKMIDANDHVTNWEYDELGQLFREIDGEGKVTQHNYNELALLGSTTNANGDVTTYQYDEVGRLKRTNYPDSSVEFAYDESGRLKTMTDPLGVTRYDYNERGELISYTAPDSTVVGYERDELGRVKEITYPGDVAVSYSYGANSRLQQVSDWQGHNTTYQYNGVGQVLTETLPNGIITSYDYDQAGQLDEILHKTASGTILASFDYTYNEVGDRSQVDEFIAGIGNTTPQEANISINGWTALQIPLTLAENQKAEDICQADDAIDTILRWHNGTWDPHPCGVPVNNYPIELGRVYFAHSETPVTWTASGYTLPAEPINVSLTAGWNDYVPVPAVQDAAAVCQSLEERGATVENVLRWHNGSWAPHPCGTPVNNFSLSAGEPVFVNVSSAIELAGQAPTPSTAPLIDGITTYEYDKLRRLTGVAYPNGDQVSYQYDRMGNRTEMTAGGVPTAYSYDKADRLMQAGDSTYSWDNAGRMMGRTINGTLTSYDYDLEDQMINAGDVTFTYDGTGRRLSKTASGQTTSYLYDLSGTLPHVLVENRPDGDIRYIYGATGLLAHVTADNEATYYHTDGLGSVRTLTDQSGQAIAGYTYDAFGEMRAAQGPTDSFGFTGEQADSETDLVYLRARYYDPTAGRFMSRDTFAGRQNQIQSLNRYIYVENNPANFIDPTGHDKQAGNDRQTGQVYPCGFIGPLQPNDVVHCPSIEHDSTGRAYMEGGHGERLYYPNMNQNSHNSGAGSLPINEILGLITMGADTASVLENVGRLFSDEITLAKNAGVLIKNPKMYQLSKSLAPVNKRLGPIGDVISLGQAAATGSKYDMAYEGIKTVVTYASRVHPVTAIAAVLAEPIGNLFAKADPWIKRGGDWLLGR